MSNSLKIKIIDHEDLLDVAGIHLLAFPESIFSKLGIDCVRRYYAWQLISSDQVYAIGAFRGSELIGYCFGGVFRMALGGFIRKNKGFLIKRLARKPWLIFHPAFTGKILQGIRLLLKFTFLKRSVSTSVLQEDKVHFGILAIASHPASRGLGVGQLLMEDSERFAREHGFARMRLTVSPKNQNAIQFYEHIDWKKDAAAGKWQGGMVRDLDHV
ncbi:MAG: GNAT family N-acetyltransferase [Candidatus Marinimicrobia bacterium]|nr:GNAT family N-acetyltransferase [Candidatus Neomarinimicrobiota bacterium]